MVLEKKIQNLPVFQKWQKYNVKYNKMASK